MLEEICNELCIKNKDDLEGFLYVVIGAIIVAAYLLLTRQHEEKIFIGQNEAVISNKIKTKFGSLPGIKVSTNKYLPNIFIDNKKNNIFRMHSLSVTINQDQKVKLEGNFSDTYDLYVPKKQQILALSIITPEMMVAIESTNDKYDMMLYEKNLYIFFTNNNLKINDENRQKLIGISEVILKELEHKLRSWTKENEQQSASAELNYFVEENFYQKQRIKLIFWSAVLVAILVFSYSFISRVIGKEITALLGAYVVFIACVFSGIYYFIKLYK